MPKMPEKVEFYHNGIVIDGEEFPWYIKDDGIDVRVEYDLYRAGLLEISFSMWVDGTILYHDMDVPEKYKRKTGRRCRVWG